MGRRTEHWSGVLGNRGEQRFQVERPRQGSENSGVSLYGMATEGRSDDHGKVRRTRVLLQSLQELETIHARHDEVEENETATLDGLEFLERLDAVLRSLDEPPSLE